MDLKVFLLIAQGFYAENRWQMWRECFRISPEMGKDSSMQHILVHDNLVAFWMFIQFQLRQSNHVQYRNLQVSTREDKGVRELIPHTGPIPILIPLKFFLDLLRDPVSPWGLQNSQSYVMDFNRVDSWAHSHALASRSSRIDLQTKWRNMREAGLVSVL